MALMAWVDFQEMRTSMIDIDAATAFGAVQILERAPKDYFDLLDYLPDATASAVELYGQASIDVAQTYAKKSLGNVILGELVMPSPSKVEIAKSAGKVALWALTETPAGQALVYDYALPKLYAGMSRLVRNQGRSYLSDVVERSKTPLSAQRIPQPDACNFCRMLSMNTYVSKEKAAVVTGSMRSKQQKNGTYSIPRHYLRSSHGQALGEKFHDHCKCEVLVTYEEEPPDIPYETQVMLDDYSDQYYLGIEKARAMYGDSHPNTSQILAGMRTLTGAK